MMFQMKIYECINSTFQSFSIIRDANETTRKVIFKNRITTVQWSIFKRHVAIIHIRLTCKTYQKCHHDENF